MTRTATDPAQIVAADRPGSRASSQTAAGADAAVLRSVLLLIAGTFLAGCAANARPSNQDLAVHGYWYEDANHPDGGGGQASPQAIQNATHGTWLWPPNQTDIPN